MREAQEEPSVIGADLSSKDGLSIITATVATIPCQRRPAVMMTPNVSLIMTAGRVARVLCDRLRPGGRICLGDGERCYMLEGDV